MNLQNLDSINKTKSDYIKYIVSTLESKEKKVIFYLNSYSYYLISKDMEFSKAFISADKIACDGVSIKLLFRLLHHQRIEKVSFNHLFYDYLQNYFSNQNYSVFLLGGKEKTVKYAATLLSQNNNFIKVKGFTNGYFDINSDSEIIIKKINESKTNILLVGMGMPLSEKWIYKYRDKLNPMLVIAVGNLFDLISGEKKIAPKYLYNSPFEWSYRMIQEPRRLFLRYLKANTFLIKELVTGILARWI